MISALIMGEEGVVSEACSALASVQEGRGPVERAPTLPPAHFNAGCDGRGRQQLAGRVFPVGGRLHGIPDVSAARPSGCMGAAVVLGARPAGQAPCNHGLPSASHPPTPPTGSVADCQAGLAGLEAVWSWLDVGWAYYRLQGCCDGPTAAASPRAAHIQPRSDQPAPRVRVWGPPACTHPPPPHTHTTNASPQRRFLTTCRQAGFAMVGSRHVGPRDGCAACACPAPGARRTRGFFCISAAGRTACTQHPRTVHAKCTHVLRGAGAGCCCDSTLRSPGLAGRRVPPPPPPHAPTGAHLVLGSCSCARAWCAPRTP